MFVDTTGYDRWKGSGIAVLILIVRTHAAAAEDQLTLLQDK